MLQMSLTVLQKGLENEIFGFKTQPSLLSGILIYIIGSVELNSFLQYDLVHNKYTQITPPHPTLLVARWESAT